MSDQPIGPGAIHGSDDVAHYGGHLIAESVSERNRGLLAEAPRLLSRLKASVLHCGCGLECRECVENLAAIVAAHRPPAAHPHSWSALQGIAAALGKKEIDPGMDVLAVIQDELSRVGL